MIRLLLTGLALLLGSSCATRMPQTPRTGSGSVAIEAMPVRLHPHDPSVLRLGSFEYAGGVEIRSPRATGLRELSDLRIVDGDQLVAVSDRGAFVEARLLFDDNDRLAGLADARVSPLRNQRGEPLSDRDADAEGLELMPDGSRLVSFERNDRICLYSADGRVLRPTHRPDARFPANAGMEAVTLYPAAGSGAYLVGSEGGTIWLCTADRTCRETALGSLVPRGLGLTALAAYGETGDVAILARAYDPRLGARVVVRLIRATGVGRGVVIDEMSLAAPLLVDNFEGIAVVPRPDGIRLYLVSDDNGSRTQHTYLLAFDWRAPQSR
jgi:hypothetical protein